MKKNLTVMTVIAGVAILISSLAISGVSFTTLEKTADPFLNGAAMVGHLTIVVYDQDGNIKKYMQTDNKITNQGENCMAEKMFGVASAGATLCQGIGATSDEVFDVIAIGTGSGAGDETDLALATFAIKNAITPTVSSSTGGASSSAVVTLLATFTATTTKTFTESGIFDTSTTANDNLLARQIFTTSATLNNGDTIEVTWTITLGPNN